jgi:hypothetical protein
MILTNTQAIKKRSNIVSFLIILSFLFLAINSNAQCNVSSPSWCVLGNSGTTSTNFLGTIDPVPLIFKTFDTEWMRITPSGNLGIFTITPAYKLDVVGDINLTGALRIGTAAGTAGQVLTSAAGGANIWTTPTAGTITSVIGIAPIISSGGTAPDISITQAGISTNGFLSSTDWNIFNTKVTGGGTVDYVPKWTPDGATLGNSSIFDNGSVSIGTTSPQAKLQVKNGSVLFDGATGNTLVTGAGTRMMWIPEKAAFRAGAIDASQWNNSNIGLYSAALGYSTTAESYACFVVGRFNRNSASYSKTTWVPTDPLFVIGNGANSQKVANALTVLKNGNVGIGTVTPSEKLDVIGLLKLSKANATQNDSPGLIFASDDDFLFTGRRFNHYGLGAYVTNVGLKLYLSGRYGLNFFTGGMNRMTIDLNGNVGIGVTNPVNKLEVCGTIRSNEWIVETGWCDYKLTASYVRMGWQEKQEYIFKYGHLPDIDPGYVIEKEGLQVAKTMKGFISNIEDNSMDIITLYKENQEQKKQIDYLTEENNILKNRLDEIDKKISKK